MIKLYKCLLTSMPFLFSLLMLFAGREAMAQCTFQIPAVSANGSNYCGTSVFNTPKTTTAYYNTHYNWVCPGDTVDFITDETIHPGNQQCCGAVILEKGSVFILEYGAAGWTVWAKAGSKFINNGNVNGNNFVIADTGAYVTPGFNSGSGSNNYCGSYGNAVCSPLTYDYSLVTAGTGCFAAVKPTAKFTGSPVSACPADTITFTDQSTGSPTSWHWTFTGGTPATSNAQNPKVVYTMPGTYAVKLVATNTSGTDSITKSSYITIGTLANAGAITGPLAVCANQSTQLSDTGSVGSLQWQSSTDGNSFANITGDTTSFNTIAGILQTTYYRVTASGGCGAPATGSAWKLMVNPLPVPGTITGPVSVCQGSALQLSDTGSFGSLQWQTSPDGSVFSSIAGDTSALLSLTADTTMYYRVTATNNCGLALGPPSVVTVNPLPVPFVTSPISQFCAGDSTMVCTSDTYISYHWNTDDTTFCTTATSAGGYWVTVTDANHCSAISGHRQITVFPVPSVSIIHQGDTLSSFGAVSYQWLRDNTPLTNDTNSIYVATQPGSYTLQVTDSNGCTATSQSLVISGSQNLNMDGSVLLFPNPSFDNWQLAVNNSWVGSVLEVYNGQGRIVFHSAISNQNSTLSPEVPSGVYWLRISNNSTSIIKKLIKL